jgi:N6-L-threonylcarbamoyladenine synthase
MEVVGQTVDDAAGEAFDKCARVMGLGYPGGPAVDRLAAGGDAGAFAFARPRVGGYDYSFSGLKTSFLYTLRDCLRGDPAFVEKRRADLCASLQHAVVEILMDKLLKASEGFGIREVAAAGGVSANRALRDAFGCYARRYGWNVYLLPPAYTTDNAAMVAVAGYLKYGAGDFCGMDAVPFSRVII